jgi:hypothetical protein
MSSQKQSNAQAELRAQFESMLEELQASREAHPQAMLALRSVLSSRRWHATWRSLCPASKPA